jgi:hypothetical protein
VSLIGDHDEAGGINKGEPGNAAEIGVGAGEFQPALENQTADRAADPGITEAGDWTG